MCLARKGTPYRGRIIQLRHVQTETCLRLSCLSFSFLDAATRSLLPAPERNETLVVLVPCAPPCEIRGPATHFEAECRVVPARDNINLDSRPHASQLYCCVSFQPSKCLTELLLAN